jgi:hypothetical protein
MTISPDRLRLYTQSCAHLVLRTPADEIANGTCFHIGDGYYVTARHVVENNIVDRIDPFTGSYILESELLYPSNSLTTIHIGDRNVQAHTLDHSGVRVNEGPHFHPDPRIDIAIIHLAGIDPNTPIVPLPSFLDEAVGDLDFILTKAVILGFPPIAFSHRADLVAVTAEVNAVADTYLDKYLRFILSAPPRGGFSGGPALHEYGFTLGVITESLELHLSTATTGFMAVLSADAIIECMDAHGIAPKGQRDTPDAED